MAGNKEISQAVIARLPRYYRFLDTLEAMGTERISSQELSKLMHVTASQIRQDLNHFGGFGQQGYGYNVTYLKDEIGKILGLDATRQLIVIGAGNLGRALLNYGNFSKSGFLFTAVFDADERKIGDRVGELTVQGMEVLTAYLKEHHVDIAVLTVPRDSAESIARTLIDGGVKAIWNFAHIDLDVPEGIQVENVHLVDSLMKLAYNARESEAK